MEKILRFYNEAREILEDRVPHPRMAIIFPIYGCNLRCRGCMFSDDNTTNHARLSKKQLTETIAQLRDLGVESVEFSGGGEPTLTPQFDEVLRFVNRCGMATGIFTNGTFSSEVAEAIVDTCTYARISLPAHSESQYKFICNPPASVTHQQVVDNIKLLCRLKTDRDSQVVVGAKALISVLNECSIVPLYEQVLDMGVDYIQYRALRNAPEELPPGKLQQLEQQISKLKAKQDGLVVQGSLLKTHLEGKCWLTPIHLVVDALGDIYPCCYYQHRREKMLLGNILRDKIEDIWGSEDHREVLSRISGVECDAYDCRWHGYNRVMKEVLLDDAVHIKFI